MIARAGRDASRHTRALKGFGKGLLVALPLTLCARDISFSSSVRRHRRKAKGTLEDEVRRRSEMRVAIQFHRGYSRMNFEQTTCDTEEFGATGRIRPALLA